VCPPGTLELRTCYHRNPQGIPDTRIKISKEFGLQDTGGRRFRSRRSRRSGAQWLGKRPRIQHQTGPSPSRTSGPRRFSFTIARKPHLRSDVGWPYKLAACRVLGQQFNSFRGPANVWAIFMIRSEAAFSDLTRAGPTAAGAASVRSISGGSISGRS